MQAAEELKKVLGENGDSGRVKLKDPEKVALLNELLDQQRKSPGGELLHDLARRTLAIARESVPVETLQATTRDIISDLQKNYDEPDPEVPVAQEIALLTVMIGALFEEIRQVGHRAAPMYGAEIVRTALDVTEQSVLANELMLVITLIGRTAEKAKKAKPKEEEVKS